MIGGRGLDPSAKWHHAQRVEKLVNVFHLLGEAGAVRLQSVVPVQAIFLEHRSAAAVVDDDRVVAVEFERDEVRVRQLPRAQGFPIVEVDRATAALALRHENVAAILLQDTRRCPVHRTKHGIRHAAYKKRHAGTLAADRRQEFWQTRTRTSRRRQYAEPAPADPAKV